MLFTARENFKSETIKGHVRCASCLAPLEGKTALVLRWTNKREKESSYVVCDDQCWEDFDHNYWLDRRISFATSGRQIHLLQESHTPTKKPDGYGHYGYGRPAVNRGDVS